MSGSGEKAGSESRPGAMGLCAGPLKFMETKASGQRSAVTTINSAICSGHCLLSILGFYAILLNVVVDNKCDAVYP